MQGWWRSQHDISPSSCELLRCVLRSPRRGYRTSRHETELPKLLALEGPVFATLKVIQGEAVQTDYDWINSIERVHELKAALAAPRRTT